MDILKIIKDEDFGLKYPPPIKYKERRAARALSAKYCEGYCEKV